MTLDDFNKQVLPTLQPRILDNTKVFAAYEPGGHAGARYVYLFDPLTGRTERRLFGSDWRLGAVGGE